MVRRARGDDRTAGPDNGHARHTPDGGRAGAGRFVRPYAPRMTTPNPHTTGETLEQMIEQIVFEDPVTHRLREQWEETKREVQTLFEKACTEQYEIRLDYHRTCGEPDAEEQARREAALIRPMLAEERERRLTLVWFEILRRVRAVLADRAAGADETPGTGSGSGTGDSSGT